MGVQILPAACVCPRIGPVSEAGSRKRRMGVRVPPGACGALVSAPASTRCAVMERCGFESCRALAILAGGVMAASCALNAETEQVHGGSTPSPRMVCETVGFAPGSASGRPLRSERGNGGSNPSSGMCDCTLVVQWNQNAAPRRQKSPVRVGPRVCIWPQYRNGQRLSQQTRWSGVRFPPGAFSICHVLSRLRTPGRDVSRDRGYRSPLP